MIAGFMNLARGESFQHSPPGDFDRRSAVVPTRSEVDALRQLCEEPTVLNIVGPSSAPYPVMRYRMTSDEGLSVTVVALNRWDGFVWGYVNDAPHETVCLVDPSEVIVAGKLKGRSTPELQQEIKLIAAELLRERINKSTYPGLSETGYIQLAETGGRCLYCKRKIEDGALCYGCGAPV
jgi:hypothetical protein